jgi:transposase
MFNPVLFDARLSQLENQIRHRLQRVGHAIQAALHNRFAMDNLNSKELVMLFIRKDCFQVKSYLLTVDNLVFHF